MTVPILLILRYDFSEHSIRSQMKALDAAVRLWMVRRSAAHFEQLADFSEKVGMEFCTIVH